MGCIGAIISIQINRYIDIDSRKEQVIFMTSYMNVTNTEELTAALARCRQAQATFATYTQEQVDRIFLAAATAANRARFS